jgi:hypothetical protein
MNIETTFWEETARLMQEYRKEGNEQRVQGIVDCRILFNRLTEQLRKHNVSGELPLDEVRFRATRFAHQCRLNAVTTNNDTVNLYDKLYGQ